MGTRADFYLGRGKNATWLGSIAWDGYPDRIPDNVLNAKDESFYLSELRLFFKTRNDVTLPEEGWPWPWGDSGTTDYAYAFDSGQVYIACYGYKWVTTEAWRLYRLRNEAYERAWGVWEDMHRWWERTGLEGDEPVEPTEPKDPFDHDEEGKLEFPDMHDRKNVQLGEKSGLFFIGGRRV
jgi:hypothetical protein